MTKEKIEGEGGTLISNKKMQTKIETFKNDPKIRQVENSMKLYLYMRKI